jgi:hypothetical protein
LRIHNENDRSSPLIAAKDARLHIELPSILPVTIPSAGARTGTNRSVLADVNTTTGVRSGTDGSSGADTNIKSVLVQKPAVLLARSARRTLVIGNTIPNTAITLPASSIAPHTTVHRVQRTGSRRVCSKKRISILRDDQILETADLIGTREPEIRSESATRDSDVVMETDSMTEGRVAKVTSTDLEQQRLRPASTSVDLDRLVRSSSSRRDSQTREDLVEASRSYQNIQPAIDADDEQWGTPMENEYGEEILEHMRTLEKRMRPNPHYMDCQDECQWHMRTALVDWLVRVHHRFTLLPETLFLAVNYVDRFLSHMVVSLGKLQLVGATAIFLAAKYEEVNCLSIQEILYVVDHGYKPNEIFAAERCMLSTLDFELGWPGPMAFLLHIGTADGHDLDTRNLAEYFLEVAVMDKQFIGLAPSLLAAGAHCLARRMLRKGHWTSAHVSHSRYTYLQVRQLVVALIGCCQSPKIHHPAVYKKYAASRLKHASLFVRAEIKKGFSLPTFKYPSSLSTKLGE